jgi:hypothetical protein
VESVVPVVSAVLVEWVVLVVGIVPRVLALCLPAAVVLEVSAAPVESVVVPVLALSLPVAVAARNGSTTPNIARVFPIVTTPQIKNTTAHQLEMSLATIHSEDETEVARARAHVTWVAVAVDHVVTVRAHATSVGRVDLGRGTVVRAARVIPEHLTA